MIKTKLFALRNYPIVKEQGSQTIYHPATDFTYCIYFFGYLIKAVPINGISYADAKLMFPNNKIIEKEC